VDPATPEGFAVTGPSSLLRSYAGTSPSSLFELRRDMEISIASSNMRLTRCLEIQYCLDIKKNGGRGEIRTLGTEIGTTP
jgi:hypothetical protein